MSKELKFEINLRMDLTSTATLDEIEVRTKDAYVVKVQDVTFKFKKCAHPEYMPKLAMHIIPGVIREVMALYNLSEMDLGCDWEGMEFNLASCFNANAQKEDGIECETAVIGDIIQVK